METNQEITKPLNILYAEDELEDRIFFEKALSGIPIPIHHKIVKNGKLLMNYLHTTEDPLPDLIFLDLSMPLKTGFECLAEIKDDDKLKNLKVVMLTASFTRGTELEDILKSTLEGMGAIDYIRKTHDMEQLKAVIQQTLYSILQQAG
jgi:CheY-like chemotaxis protein